MRDYLTIKQRRLKNHSVKVMKRFSHFTIQWRTKEGRPWNDVPAFTNILGLRSAEKALEQYKKTNYKGRSSDLRIVPKLVANTIRETRNTEFGKKAKRPKKDQPDD